MIGAFPKLGAGRLALPRVAGIPVFHDSASRAISDSRGIWPFKRIVVNDEFFRLSPPEQGAILLHEVGHCRMFHLEKRIAALPMLFLAPRMLSQLCIEQEFEADEYSAAQGFAPWLIYFFRRMNDGTNTLLHPTFAARIERLSNRSAP